VPLNPFTWTGPIRDGVSRGPFTERVALTLKGGTHVALFGPRGTGKTSFITDLTRELAREHEADAPPWDAIAVDLRHAISLPAFIGAVQAAVDAHPNGQLRRRAIGLFRALEKEIGVNLGLVRAGVRSGSRRTPNTAVVLRDQLAALASAADRLVIVLDEFQRLRSCPGEPLSVIRHALMGPDHAGRVSLLLTGSLRERLRMMLEQSAEPIWDQTLEETLPDLDHAAFAEFLELRFAAGGRPIGERAVEHLLALTHSHPKRTQHVAWHVFDRARPGATIEPSDVDAAFDMLVASRRENPDFAGVIDTLMSGNDPEENDAKALFLLAGGGSPGSDVDAARYGLADRKAASRALGRLLTRGLVEQTPAGWRIVDPLLAAWLRQQDPVAS
jgi:hypothetical protein